MKHREAVRRGESVNPVNTEFAKMVQRAEKYVARLNYNHFLFPDKLETLPKAVFDQYMKASEKKCG